MDPQAAISWVRQLELGDRTLQAFAVREVVATLALDDPKGAVQLLEEMPDWRADSQLNCSLRIV